MTSPPPEIPETAEPAGPPPGLWATVREALRGNTRRDFTRGPLGRAIFLLAVPMVLEVSMESLFAIVDVFWVSKLGADAAATVGLTESMLVLVYTLAIGLSIGVTALVARRIGEKDFAGASRVAVQAVALGVMVAVPIGLLGAFFSPQLLRLMGASSSVIENGVGFTRIMFAGNVTVLLLFLINAIFRGAGDAAIAMRVLWLANAINLILDPCFIFGLGPFPELGVAGAAVATNIGRGTGVLFQLYILYRGRGRIAVRRPDLRLDGAVMRKVFQLSGAAMFQVLIATASWIGLVRILSGFGSQVLAGYTIGIRIIMFALLPSWGMSNAAATLVGQALGAGKPERAEQAVWRTGFYNMLFLGSVGAVLVIWARPIVELFIQDPGVIPYGVGCLRTISCGFLFYAFGMVFTQAFNGSGDTWTPTRINLFVFWILEIPLAWYLSHRTDLGPQGAFLAVAIAFSTLALVSGAAFRAGRWKTRKI